MAHKNEVLHWDTFWENLTWPALVAPVVSLVATLVMVVMYRRLHYVRRTPGGFIIRSNVCDMLQSIGFILIFCYASDVDSKHHTMWALLPVTCAFDIAATVYRALMYIHLINVYRNPFKPRLHRPIYHFIVWCISAIMIIAWSREIGSERCHEHCFAVLAWGFLVVPFLIFVLFGCTAYVAVRVLLHSTQTRTGRSASISSLAQQRASRHGLAYMVLYGAQHVIGLGLVGLLQLYPKYWILWVLYVFTCARPAISFLGWMVINDVVYVQFRVCSFTKTRSRILSGPDLLVPSSMASSESAEQRHIIQEEMARRAERNQGMEDGFKQELRFELLYDIARGIGDLAHAELRSDSEDGDIEYGKVKRSNSLQMDLPHSPHITSSFQEPCTSSAGLLRVPSAHDTVTTSAGLLRTSSDPAHCMGVARQLSRQSHQPLVAGEDRAAARIQDCRSCFKCGVGGADSLHNYEKEAFRAIRTAFGISEVTYARAFPNEVTDSDSQWKEKLKESVSEGASGSFFYRVMSSDSGVCKSRYIVKQITLEEKNTLIKILPAYRQYVTQRQGRTLIQYFGCHSVPLRWKYSARVYFVVMRNYLPLKCWLVFDLKGATANRRALAPNLLHRAHAGADPRGGAVYGTLRDWEWMDIAMATDIPADAKMLLADTVAADAEFLKSQNLLDYSLLVGIHRLPLDLTPAQHEARLAELEAAGGWISVDRQKVYFFGIIDVLEKYTLRWQLQNMVLATGYQVACKSDRADGISALKPALYADRFFTFVQQEVLRTPGGEHGEEEQTWPGCCGWLCGNRTIRPLGGTSGSERWGHLWQRQRRGLVRERIEVERTDFLRRIEELERQLYGR